MEEYKVSNLIDLLVKLIKCTSVEDIINKAKINDDFFLYNNSESTRCNIIYKLMNLANKLLIIKEGEILCKYKSLLQWRRFTTFFEEDLLIVAYLVYQTVYKGKNVERFDWQFIINHDNKELNKILSQGMADNHFHLWGSVPLFQHSWMYFMGNTDRINQINDQTNLSQLLRKAALIRQYLEYVLKNNRTDSAYEEVLIPAVISNQVETFYETRGLKMININESKHNGKYSESVFEMYTEERKFLYNIMLRIFNLQKISRRYISIVYIYIILKEKVREAVVQTANNIGAENFYEVNLNKRNLINTHECYRDLSFPFVINQMQADNIVSLEIRIKIQETPEKMAEYINMIENFMDPQHKYRKRIKYIIHFSRKCEQLNVCDEVYREYNRHIIIRKQWDVLMVFLNNYKLLATRVAGIDVCSHELVCKPEVFAFVFRNCEYKYNKKLKRTYHVGEEYEDILTGLRAIDECIAFLGLSIGDRLGHALPLGIDIYDWYQKKNNFMFTSKEDVLDNISWLYHRIKDISNYKKYLYQLEEIFKELFEQVYGGVLSRDCIEASIGEDVENKLISLDLSCFSIDDYYNSWELRGENPKSIIKNLNDILDSKSTYKHVKALVLTSNYFYNTKIRELGKEKIKVELNSIVLDMICEVQRQIKYDISNKKIKIESCPSSNLLTGAINRYFEHSIKKIYSKGLTEEDDEIQIITSINTDDQAIFNTSLKLEYSIMANALEMAVDKYGNKLYDKHKVYKWIDNIRKNSFDMRF